jgi:hypothetical protein
MGAGDSPAANRADTTFRKTHYVRWEIVKPRADSPHCLNSLGPVTIRFRLRVETPIQRGHSGIALFNVERQLIWAWATSDLELKAGETELSYTFPMLPLRPGPYSWQVSIWDEKNLLDLCDCTPEMIISTENFQHALDEWNGILNVPVKFEVSMEEQAKDATGSRI